MKRVERHRLRIKRINQVINLFKQGYTDRAMAELVGVSISTVKEYRTAAGLYRTGPYKRVEDRAPKINEDYKKPPQQTPQTDVRPALSTLQEKLRKCLRCSRLFQSRHAGERVCTNCRSSSAWRDGNDYVLSMQR